MHSPHTEDPPPSPSTNGVPPSPRGVPETKLPKVIRAVKDSNTYKHKGRTLIVCLDGTGDKFDNDNSNVVHLVSCLKKDDPSQVTYYQSGIGTYDGKGMRSGFSAAADMAVGSGLGVHVTDAYRFLMQTYKEGDKICLFGFSRGAYTARCVAGMLHKVGLLPPYNEAQVPFAYQFYKDDTEQGWKMSEEFKKTFCISASVYFVGVWDCVASVGFIPRKLPFSSTPTSRTGHFRHAMALDEHRAKFKCLPWQKIGTKGQVDSERRARERADLLAAQNPQPNGNILRAASTRLSAKKEGGDRSTKNGSISSKTAPSEKDEKTNGRANGNVNGKPAKAKIDAETMLRTEQQAQESDVLEVWFTGAHADVGGGAVANDERHKLSQVPLRWMLRQCFECDTGIMFYTSMLAEKGLDVHTLSPVYRQLPKPVVGPSPKMMEKYQAGTLAPIRTRSSHIKTIPEETKSKKEQTEKEMGEQFGIKFSKADLEEEYTEPEGDWTPEQVEDYFDAMSPLNDQLVVAKGWWVLEVWPIKVKIQRAGEDEWEKKVSVNWGRYRPVQNLDPNVHWTVRQRMRDKGYKMQTRNDRNSVWTVVV